MKPIAYLRAPFSEKFGVPRQSGLARTVSEVVLAPEYRNPDALRGLDGFSHVWLIWQFDKALREEWSPTVRPPRLGGNVRMGVFATRSPFRPNHIGLSCVRLHSVEGYTLRVIGADMVDGTPIYDIKPYLPYCDAHPDALGGWTDNVSGMLLHVDCRQDLLARIPQEQKEGLLDLLAADPRPRYQDDPQRIYGVSFAGHNVKFCVAEDRLTVIAIDKECP